MSLIGKGKSSSNGCGNDYTCLQFYNIFYQYEGLTQIMESTIVVALNNIVVIFNHVRLNLFNHVLAFFHTKFACNLAIRYPVFRWEFCKGSVWKSVKKTQDVCTQEEPHDWILWLASCQRWHTCKACRGAEGSR